MKKRLTLLDKWQIAQEELNKLKKDYINNFLKDKEIPYKIYEATPHGFIEKEITKIYTFCKNEPKLLYGTIRPKKVELENLLKFIENFDNEEKFVYVGYKQKFERYTVTGADSWEYIQKNEKLSFDKESLIPIQKELKEKYAPKEGHKPCAHCGKQVPEDKLVYCKIIFQDSKPDITKKSGYRKFVNEKTLGYCSSKCGGYDQMAHEG